MSSHQSYKQGWSLKEFAQKAPPPGWEEFFLKEVKEDFHELNKKIKPGPLLRPAIQNVFRPFDYCSPDQIKVVILGCEPYKGAIKGINVLYATGLAYETPPEAKPNESIRAITEELIRSYPNTKVEINLVNWAKQGVLLLNICSAMNEGSARNRIWDSFTIKVLKYLKRINPKLIFLLWGSEAQSIFKLCDFKTGSNFFASGHPCGARFSGVYSSRAFKENNHFILANETLVANGHEPINWVG